MENTNQSNVNKAKIILTSITIGIANILIVLAMPMLSDDFVLGRWTNAIIIIFLLTIANTILWPIFTRILMRFFIITFGIGALLLNGLMFYGVAYYLPEVKIGIGGALIATLFINIATTLIFNIANIDFYNRHIIKKLSKKVNTDKKAARKYSGVIMIEIDGLAKEILDEAIGKGYMPTLKRWIENKTHTLKEWETDLSSQTGASQAGILHGNNKDIIAYRWVEKENNNKIIVSSNFSHAPLIENKISDGNGLLSDNGASRANMFSGDSDDFIFTSSKIIELDKLFNKTWYSVFTTSNSFQRIFVLFLWDILKELKSQIIHKIKNIRPRMKRGIIYATLRAGGNVFLREVVTETLAGDILNGEINSAYATYVGYDEVAHHSGIRDNDVWSVLKEIDLEINRLENAESISKRHYDFVILSDHGQGNGATFKQRYGITLGNFVRRFLPEDMKSLKIDEELDHFKNSYIPRNESIENIKEKMDTIKNYDIFNEYESLQNFKEKSMDLLKIDELCKTEEIQKLRKKYNDSLDYIRGYEASQHTTKKASDSELIVLGSGNLGLIYLTQWKNRLTYEEIISLFPDLIPGLVKHPGIGFILVNSIANGGMVIGENGIYYLESDEITGENPLANFGKNASKHLKRHNTFKNMPDILVNSFYDPESGDICAFEELIGSHGGLGGTQTKPFILYPSDWDCPEELVGAKSIYDFLKNGMKKLKEE